jgi:hypothetical protein
LIDFIGRAGIAPRDQPRPRAATPRAYPNPLIDSRFTHAPGLSSSSLSVKRSISRAIVAVVPRDASKSRASRDPHQRFHRRRLRAAHGRHRCTYPLFGMIVEATRTGRGREPAKELSHDRRSRV